MVELGYRRVDDNEAAGDDGEVDGIVDSRVAGRRMLAKMGAL